MEFPKSVKLGGHVATVEFEQDLQYKEGRSATAHTGYQVIRIDPAPCETVKWSSLFHEVLELYVHMYELEIDHPKITVLGEAMYQFWNDNLRDK